MPSFKTVFVAVTTVLASVVRADYVIDPNSVPLSTRTSWCASELSTCPLICQQTKPGTTEVNTCDPKTLTYGCVCGNGMQPNISEYSLTLPYFTCTEWGNQCVKACGQNNECSRNCREGNPCGALNPTTENSTSTSASASATASSTASSTANQIFTGAPTSTSTSSSGSSSSPSGNAAPNLMAGSTAGVLIVCMSMFAGFAFVL